MLRSLRTMTCAATRGGRGYLRWPCETANDVANRIPAVIGRAPRRIRELLTPPAGLVTVPLRPRAFVPPNALTESEPLNFKKLMLIVIPLALVLAGWQYFSKVDRSDPVKVANAFAKALHSKNTGTAANYYMPEEAQAWRENLDSMRSGASERYFERVPADANFGAPTTSKAGVTVLQSADKTFAVEMKQVG